MKHILQLCLLLVGASTMTQAQWIPDNGDGTYKNPVIYADYSDPDVIRVGDDFYMVASSFNCMPGIPVLHSEDLVNWTIIGHVYDRLPFERYNKPVHGEGSWAPSIRYHNSRFYVYFCTPSEGLFMTTAENPAGPWEPLTHVVSTELWEDPCPFWDDDGTAWLVHSKLCGTPLILHRMSDDGKTLLDNGTVIFDDPVNYPTLEGPKFLKKDGFYYILAPAGGVEQGWQAALRSTRITGPYEAKVVMAQGKTGINGPHQGGITDTPAGSWWFVHFQAMEAYGRIIRLEPVTWRDNWPVMGTVPDSGYTGTPVTSFEKPVLSDTLGYTVPQTTDHFDDGLPGLQWQWQANPSDTWYEPLSETGMLRLNAVSNITNEGNPWYAPNLLLQKFPAPAFTAVTRVKFYPGMEGDKAGLIVMGERHACICFTNTSEGLRISRFENGHDQCGEVPAETDGVTTTAREIFLRVRVGENATCTFAYSEDGTAWKTLGGPFTATPGRWIGAKVGIFYINPNIQESPGYADFDFFQVETEPENQGKKNL